MAMPKTFDFPYAMRGDTCPTCKTARDAIDGRSLRAAREVRALSLREVARRIGLSATYSSQIERNPRHATRKVLALYKRGLA